MSSSVSCFLEPRLTLFTTRPRPAISGFAENAISLKEGRVRPGSGLDGIEGIFEHLPVVHQGAWEKARLLCLALTTKSEVGTGEG